MRILYVIDTHIHADHMSDRTKIGQGRRCRLRAVCRSEAAAAPFHGVRDRDVLQLGNVSVRSFTRPDIRPNIFPCSSPIGHAPTSRGSCLTGHTLMVGDVGRTELAATAEEGARILFRSLQRLKTLPDYLEVLPGAFSGSVCGRLLSGKPMSTIGFERRHNVAFRIEDEEEFVRAMPEESHRRRPVQRSFGRLMLDLHWSDHARAPAASSKNG